MDKIILRGNIYYVHKEEINCGSEQTAGRPAIVVSNNDANRNSGVVEVVYLTSKVKRNLPTHVTIKGSGRVSTALCEQITSVSVERIGDYLGMTTESEMVEIENAIHISLGLPVHADKNRSCIEAERDFYKTAYETLLEKLIRRDR